MTGTTSLKFLTHYGNTPSIYYGTSDGADIHGIDECVSIDSMTQTGPVLAVFIAPSNEVNRRG